MSRRYTNADPTADQAMGQVGYQRTFHKRGCVVDGGPEIHGRPWRGRTMRGTPGLFTCPKCASSIEGRLESTLIILDSRRPA